MAGDVVNIKVCSPLKLRSGLTGEKPAICHYSYNLPLVATLTDNRANFNRQTKQKTKPTHHPTIKDY
jgi:hypothetical protein